MDLVSNWAHHHYHYQYRDGSSYSNSSRSVQGMGCGTFMESPFWGFNLGNFWGHDFRQPNIEALTRSGKVK